MFGFGFVANDRVRLDDGREGIIVRGFIGTLYYQVKLENGNEETVHRDQMKRVK
jgi:hypothetical protein